MRARPRSPPRPDTIRTRLSPSVDPGPIDRPDAILYNTTVEEVPTKRGLFCRCRPSFVMVPASGKVIICTVLGFRTPQSERHTFCFHGARGNNLPHVGRTLLRICFIPSGRLTPMTLRETLVPSVFWPARTQQN